MHIPGQRRPSDGRPLRISSQLSHRSVPACLGAVRTVGVSEVVVGGRRETVGVRDGRQGNPREEAVVEEAALEAEVDEGIEGVPDEKKAAGLEMVLSSAHSDRPYATTRIATVEASDQRVTGSNRSAGKTSLR